MTITTTIINETIENGRRLVWGKSVISGVTNTGDVATGLKGIDTFLMTVGGASAQGQSVDETFPLAGGDVTIYTESNDSTVYWLAIGVQ